MSGTRVSRRQGWWAQAQARRQAEERVTVRDFGGDLYIAFDGQPLVCADQLKEPWQEVLEVVRSTYADYLTGKNK